MVATASLELDARAFKAYLAGVEDHLRNPRPALEAIHRSFVGIETHQFSSQGQLSGGWAPLSASRIEVKAKHGLDPRILHATGRLRSSLTKPTSPDHVFTVAGDTLTMGTRVPYAGPHDRARRAGMPRRPLIVITREHTGRWANILRNWFFRGQR